MTRRAVPVVIGVLVSFAVTPLRGQSPVEYRLSFPEPEHRWMQVEAVFTDVPAGPLELRMSRTSPGRYALHEFAKNVFALRVTDSADAPLPVTRPNPHQWNVTGHQGTVRVAYQVFGDRIDGTYLAVDTTHAHINMPAALIWARGFERRAATVRFIPPAGTDWRVATQLFPGPDAMTFTAPNLQYLMDSPSELGAFAERTFTLSRDGPTFRVAVHHDGVEADVDRFARDVETVVREARDVFGELPPFDGHTYTFIADYLPWAHGDGMEHRNSTILTSSSSIRSNRVGLLETASHEFFHAWNVERIRPKSLEPFSFEEANMSGELWLGEGFTQYYGPLILHRAGLTDLRALADSMTGVVNAVLNSPGRRQRTAEEMSLLAPFVDAAAAIDRTAFDNTYLSYYTWGAGIGLALDLTLRERTGSVVTLDHFMRALWNAHGKPGGSQVGYVDRPYTAGDVMATLSSVSGDEAFAREFFARYIQGREVADYARLLERAGLVLRLRNQGDAFAGDVALREVAGRVLVAAAVPFDTPLYHAGLERDDALVAIEGEAVRSAGDLARAVAARQPGDRLTIVFERRGRPVTATLALVQDPRHEIVPAETAGVALSREQQRFRAAWLGSTDRNTF